ncbi:plasminogen-like [Branchiostoma floridae]|uniref:Plasminogen-like n=1 Tax=Branchiostoma floridae TaxID=7739 RepID=A0A9J7LHB2_BRAFL|nr:plasminogen-like [Branchiostoma floridae]
MVSDLQLGQEYLRQAILYARDELRLRNIMETHAAMQIRDGQYVLPGHNIQDWADSVLSHGSDGVDQVLYNLLEMMKPQSGLFGGKSLFDIYKEPLINDKNRFEKLNQKAAQIYGLIGGGYAVWITALRIKGRTSDIPAKAEEMERELATVGSSLQKYIETSCQDGNGAFYRGTVSVTGTGKPCQRWTSQSPHEHSYTPANYPSSGLEQNYCRNPDGESVPGVWCYTTHQGTRWEYCDVPQCNEETCQRGNGVSYKGTASVTESGKTCQRWDSQTPHEHGVTPAEYPSSLLLKNYCRSLGGDSSAFGVWCYTTDPSTRWEYCDVPACAEPCQVGDGVSYRGTVSVTESGKTCQRWDSQSPHEHIETLDNYPEAGLLKNYCRSQGGDSIASGVWCYTTDPSTRWEYCDVPRC